MKNISNSNFFNDKLVQIYHGYDYAEIERVKLMPAQTTEKYIIFVGRLERIKGAHTLLKAMQSFPHIKLKIIGDGTQEAELKALKTEHQLNNVEFLGKKSKSEVLQIVKEADFLICPSECYEVLGFTVVEAMALGKPVIGARIGGIPEMVIDNYTGLLFEPGNAAQLADRIEVLYDNESLVTEMGKNALDHINKLINNKTHYESLQKLIPGL